jgi:hypothetical protein
VVLLERGKDARYLLRLQKVGETLRRLRARDFPKLLARAWVPDGTNPVDARRLRILRALTLGWMIVCSVSILMLVIPFIVAKVVCR